MKRILFLPIAALALAVPAIAQHMSGAPGAWPHRPDFAGMERRRGDDIALVLGLSAAQRPLLDAFLTHPQPPAPPAPPAADATPPSFAQELDRMEQDTARHLVDERRHLAAARAFYGALDARQKTVFDALMRLSHEGPGHEGPGHESPGGGHGPGGPHGHGGPHGPGGPGGPGGPDGPDGPPPPPPAQ